MTEYERFGLVFTKTRVYKFGHRETKRYPPPSSKYVDEKHNLTIAHTTGSDILPMSDPSVNGKMN
jgi:hypothetical protein